MFIRWKTEDGVRCRAVLVDSMRTLSGPRLKHVGYLGSFKENNLAQDNTRAWFWQSARRRLDQLGICGKITSREREKIEAALAQRVPPIAPEQEATCSGPGHSRRFCDVGRESALGAGQPVGDVEKLAQCGRSLHGGKADALARRRYRSSSWGSTPSNRPAGSSRR
jgi:hypothetical protein